MDIKKLSKEELEKLSHLDIAYGVLKFDGKTLTTIDLLKEICKYLEYDEAKFDELIGDFYTSLNLDKRFILIEGKWDLTEKHPVKIIIDDDLDDDLEEFEDLDDADEDEEKENIEDDAVSEDVETLEDVDDELEDELEDLTIIEEDELEEES